MEVMETSLWGNERHARPAGRPRREGADAETGTLTIPGLKERIGESIPLHARAFARAAVASPFAGTLSDSRRVGMHLCLRFSGSPTPLGSVFAHWRLGAAGEGTRGSEGKSFASRPATRCRARGGR